MPLQTVTLHLRYLDLEAIGFVHLLHEAALQAASVDPYLSEGDMRAVAFQRGFAEWIGETHLNRGLKLRACSDALIATAGYFPFADVVCFMGATVRTAGGNKHRRAVCRNTLVTCILESDTSPPKQLIYGLLRAATNPSLGSETLSERQHLATLWDN